MPPDTGDEPAWTRPALIRGGMFAGRWMSFLLEVAQEPIHGRRKTEKDRRPLAPSPIVRLWIKEHRDAFSQGVEVDYSEIEVSHLVCAADLVPARGDESEPLSPAKSTRSRSPLSPGTGQEMESEDDRQATSRQMPKTTGRNIYGNIHVAGIRVPAREGVVGLWFLFTDLCIRHEGRYSLRFRCFDMTAIDSSSSPEPALVETQSADFRVYSPRNFPGLPRPTELADHFAKLGYKLNTRKNERQATSPSPTDK